MEVLEEKYISYEIWCRPDLKRNRYSFSEIKTKRLSETEGGSTALLKHFRETEKRRIETSGILESESPVTKDKGYDEYTSALSTTSESYLAIQNRLSDPRQDTQPDTPAKTPAYQPRLKRIRNKISNAVFDFSEIEQERIEQEINDLVNSDGYYNEVEPVDIDVEYKKKEIFSKPAIIAIVCFVIYVIIILFI